MSYAIMSFRYKGGTAVNIYNNKTRQLPLGFNLPKLIPIMREKTFSLPDKRLPFNWVLTSFWQDVCLKVGDDFLPHF